jgi:bifunctional oligoribonuclease and PAP phosphatase NrnA
MPSFPAAPEWDKAVTAITDSSSILLLAHVTPDADALGSALGLGLALQGLGKKVQVTVGEPGFTTPTSLDFLPGTELIRAPEDLAPVDLVISCDVSSDARLGSGKSILEAAAVSVAIDHHPSFTGFGTIHLVDPSAAATAEIVLELIDRLDLPITKEIAGAIYSGLATDTGSFKYQSTTSHTLRAAARLLDTGIDSAKLSRLLFDDEPLAALVMMGDAVSRATLIPAAASGLGLVYTCVSIEQRPGLDELAVERVIEALRKTAEAEVAAVLKQADDGHWKVSLRSKTTVDVGAIANELGGGGHRHASGYSSTVDLDETVACLIDSLALKSTS